MVTTTDGKNWVRVRDTMLATEVPVRVAGKMLKDLGFEKMKKWDSELKQPVAYVEARAEYFTLAEIQGALVFKEAGATVPAPTRAVKKALEGPSYAELVEMVEQQDRIIQELREEVRQLRQHRQPQNGMSERARKALAAARATIGRFKE